MEYIEHQHNITLFKGMYFLVTKYLLYTPMVFLKSEI